MSSHLRAPLLVGIVIVSGLAAVTPSSLGAQTADRNLEAIASWVALDAATRYEGRTSPALASALGAIENSSAQAAGIPLQIGLTQGGTDGSSFTYWGAPNHGLSWPGRYSHSPGEVLDLRDLDNLVRLIVAVATER